MKKFFILVNLVNRVEPEKLVAHLKSRPRLSKDQVIRESKHYHSRTRHVLILYSDQQDRRQ